MNLETVEAILLTNPEANQLNLLCRLTKARECKSKTVSHFQTNNNVTPISKSKTTTELRIEAEAFNCFEDFLFEMYISDANSFPMNSGEIELAISNQSLFLANTSCYSIVDGIITMYDPSLKPAQVNKEETNEE